MTLDEWKEKLNELKDILSERLKYSEHWANVHLKIKKTFLEIKWYDPKKEDIYDPRGKVIFKVTRIAPLNKSNLWEEVKRQERKLECDKQKNV